MAVYTWNKRTEYGGKDAPAWKQDYGWDFVGYDNAILEAIPTSGTGTAYRIGFLISPNSLHISWGNGVVPKKTSTGYLLQRTAPQQGQLSISGVMVDGAGTPERLYTLQRFSQLMEDKQGEDGVYVTYEGIPDMWTKYTFEHPALTGVFGMLPGDGVDKETFKRTLSKVCKEWQFKRIWGWDFPMMAMAAARTGQPELAVDMLMHWAPGFQFDEHGLATGGPYPYFPSNGALLG